MEQGLIYSQNALKLYQFIELTGPSPEAALQRVCKRKTEKYLKQLLGARYIRKRSIKNEIWYYLPGAGNWDLTEQRIRAWFCARWLEIGGTIQDDRVVVSPAGMLFVLDIKGDMATIQSDKYKYKSYLQNLKTEPNFDACLKIAK